MQAVHGRVGGGLVGGQEPSWCCMRSNELSAVLQIKTALISDEEVDMRAEVKQTGSLPLAEK